MCSALFPLPLLYTELCEVLWALNFADFQTRQACMSHKDKLGLFSLKWRPSWRRGLQLCGLAASLKAGVRVHFWAITSLPGDDQYHCYWYSAYRTCPPAAPFAQLRLHTSCCLFTSVETASPKGAMAQAKHEKAPFHMHKYLCQCNLHESTERAATRRKLLFRNQQCFGYGMSLGMQETAITEWVGSRRG